MTAGSILLGHTHMETRSGQARISVLRITIGLALTLAVWFIYEQTLSYDFVNYTDDVHVTDNPVLRDGLSWSGIQQTFAPEYRGYYYPLTILSFMLDIEIHGWGPSGFHLTNVVLHIATAIALFLVLWQFTGQVWCSVFVAAVFAVHPLRVESVAWITERKDVLSGLFFMLTLAAYGYYARRPFSWLMYGLVGLLFALGLLAKPMLMTLPLVLLLLDYWPLRRFDQVSRASIWQWVRSRVVLEKLPLLLLAVLSAASVTYSHVPIDAPLNPENISLPWRLGNAIVSYAVYMLQLVAPVGLVVHYPHPGSQLPLWQVIVSLLVLLGISGFTIWHARQRPYLIVGWLWYLVMLLPVIGIVRVLADAARGDRFTYLPQIGLVILITWGIAELSARWPGRRLILSAAGAVVVLALMLTARTQTTHWRDSLTLWSHTLEHTTGNYLAHNHFADSLLNRGYIEPAIEHYQQVLQIREDHTGRVYNSLGVALAIQGDYPAAIDRFRQALQRSPDDVETHFNLGRVQLAAGDLGPAESQFERVLQLQPNYIEAYLKLGQCLARQGDLPAAISQIERAIKLQPNHADAHSHLGNAHALQGELSKATECFMQAVRLNPDHPGFQATLMNALLQLVTEGQVATAIEHYEVLLKRRPNDGLVRNNFAWLLATTPDDTHRNGSRAIELAQASIALSGNNAAVLDTLAAAYATAGQFSKAIDAVKQALQLARSEEDVNAFRARLRLFEAGQAYIEK